MKNTIHIFNTMLMFLSVIIN